MKNKKFYTVTSLAYNFTMEKVLVNIIFGVNLLQKKVRLFLQLLKCKRMTRLYLYVDDLEQGDMQKGGFQRMVYIRRVVVRILLF